MTTAGLSHINFHADRPLLDALRDFYCDVVGLRQGPRPPFPDFGYWLYAGDDPIVHLYVTVAGEVRRTDVSTSFDHVAFECSNRNEVEATLRSLGVHYRTAVVPLTKQVQFFLKDPAGNSVELNFAEADG
jgi:catechol 2,3-dioxygenase-like lactoylglutathione lyase family enzyme